MELNPKRFIFVSTNKINKMDSLVITNTDGTKFITSRFGKVQLTDNINIANTYKSDEILSPLVIGYSLKVGEQLMTEQTSKFYTSINF